MDTSRLNDVGAVLMYGGDEQKIEASAAAPHQQSAAAKPFLHQQQQQPNVDHFPELNNQSRREAQALFQRNKQSREHLWSKCAFFLQQLRDTEKANIYQVTCISFVFYFYTGVLALPSVDILKVSYGEEDLLFYTSTLFMLSGILCFISSTVIGTLSDKVGRKPFLILSLGVLLIPLLLLLIKKYLFALYINALLYILMAGPTLAYISTSDVTTTANRDQGFGMVAATVPCASILGPLVSILLYSSPYGSDALSLTAIALLLMAIVCAMLCYVIQVLPEPLSEDRRNKTQINLKQLNPFSNMIDSLCDKRLFLILFICVLITIPQEAIQGTYTVFLKSYLGMSNSVTVLLISELALLASLGLGFSMQRFVAVFTHRIVLFMTILVQFCAFVLAAYSTNFLLLFVNGFLLSFAYISYPTLVAYTSLFSEASTQGTVLGALTGIRQLLFAVVPMFVWLINKSTNVDFGKAVDKSKYLIAPAYLIVGLFNILALPFVFFLESLEFM